MPFGYLVLDAHPTTGASMDDDAGGYAALIRTLWIQSFKAFSEAPSREAPGIALQPFTVLVGPNGSGKSTILQAIDTLGWLSNGTIKEMLDSQPSVSIAWRIVD